MKIQRQIGTVIVILIIWLVGSVTVDDIAWPLLIHSEN